MDEQPPLLMLIDTHTHIFVDEFTEDIDQVIERAIDAGIRQMYLPNIDIDSVEALHDLTGKYPNQCYPMMGLHPCSVKPETWKSDLEKIHDLFSKREYIAVGEIGLDLYWDKSTFEIQRQALAIQCGWALDSGKPVSLHSRDATRECIEVIRPFANKGLKGVFHCFSGTAEEAAEIIQMGFLLGIGGVLTFKKSILPELLNSVDIRYLVLETDAPYLAPIPFRGKRNEPSYLKYIVETLAGIYSISPSEAASITTQNALNIFQHAK